LFDSLDGVAQLVFLIDHVWMVEADEGWRFFLNYTV
jgi:hypothetical protein